MLRSLFDEHPRAETPARIEEEERERVETLARREEEEEEDSRAETPALVHRALPREPAAGTQLALPVP